MDIMKYDSEGNARGEGALWIVVGIVVLIIAAVTGGITSSGPGQDPCSQSYCR